MEFLQTHEKNANDDVIQLSQVLVKALLTQQTLRRGFSTIEASFVELCDHLIVTFEPRDQDRSIKVEELIVDNKRPPKSFFAPKKGEPAIAIKIPEEPSITELIELINVVRNLVYSPTINNEGRIKLIAWIKRTKEYSQNLREAGIAMAYVSHLAIASANSLDTEAKKLNDLYLKSATLIYRLGDMIDVDRRVQNSQPDIFEALNEIMSINDHDKSKIDAALAKGIKYARFGKEYGEEDNLEEKYDINRAVEVYKWLLNRPTSFFLSGDVNSGSSGIIKSILENAIPSHVQSVDQQQAEIKQIPNDVAEALFIRGQEKVYQELRIPTWAKKFLKEDISQLTDEGIIKYLQKIGIDSLTFQHQVLSQFAPELQIIKETEEFKYLSLEEFYQIQGFDKARSFLQAYQKALFALGLNKSYIHTFSNWFEDPNFFDEKKLKKIEETNEVSNRDMQVLSNSENSIKQMKEYYESLGEEGLLTYANWQRAMLKIIIESMRICYSGWSRDYSSALSDSSPTKIVEREQLNCVGRTAFMLIKILEQLGIKGYLASQWYHVACLGKFADGKEMLIEPSGMKGEELSPATEIKNNDNVLAKGERIIEVVTFSDGEVIKTRFLITGSKRIAISALSNYVAGLKENTDLKNFVYQQAITSSDIFNLFSSNADSSLSDDEIYILIRKFQLLEPDYFDFNSRQKILVITSAHERAEKKIRKYWDKVIEKYGPLI